MEDAEVAIQAVETAEVAEMFKWAPESSMGTRNSPGLPNRYLREFYFEWLSANALDLYRHRRVAGCAVA